MKTRKGKGNVLFVGVTEWASASNWRPFEAYGFSVEPLEAQRKICSKVSFLDKMASRLRLVLSLISMGFPNGRKHPPTMALPCLLVIVVDISEHLQRTECTSRRSSWLFEAMQPFHQAQTS